MKNLLPALLWLLTSAAPLSAALPAFPGAEGFGANTPGGRGGRVIEVTNLNDSGPGSFRAAVEAEGPRVVVFRTGGTIELMTEIVIAHPFLTVAGQTAPGGGITLKTHPSNHRSALTIAKTAHDVVIRFLRSRPGPHEGFPKLKSGKSADTSEIKDALQILGAHRVIIDHCSFSWATDEVVSTYFDCQDVTVQWCIIAEALRKSRPDQDLPGKGLLIGSKGGGRISVHHNLMAHNVGRNPLIKTAGLVDVVNNLAIAPQAVAMAIDAEHGHSPANIVSNHVLLPNAEGGEAGLLILRGDSYAVHAAGNLLWRRGMSQPSSDVRTFVSPNNNGHSWLVDEPHPAPDVTALSADAVMAAVVDGAGCIVPKRDAVDERILTDVRDRKARIVNVPADVGGWPTLDAGAAPVDTDHDGMPDEWEARQNLNSNDPADANMVRGQPGYTNIEVYLNHLAANGGRR